MMITTLMVKMMKMPMIMMSMKMMMITTCSSVGHQQMARFLLSMQFTFDCSDTLVMIMMIKIRMAMIMMIMLWIMKMLKL